MTDAPTRAIRVFFFGDSICFGQGVSLHHGWVPRLATLLADAGEEMGQAVEVSNLSVNGNTTRLALERMPYDIQGHEPEIVIVQFGMNDCNVWESDRGLPRVSPQAFKANLMEIVERARRFGARRVFLHNNHLSGRFLAPMAHCDHTFEDANQRYNEIVREAAKELQNECVLTDIEARWRERVGDDESVRLEYVLEDRLHPSVAGHELYLDIVRPPLIQAVRQIASEDSAGA